MKADLKIDWADFKSAKYACEKWHYSKCIPVGKLIKIGVWENSKFIGVVIFGRGANKSLGNPYGLKQTECCELVRIALREHLTPVTKIVAISLRLIKRHTNLKLIVSFADSEQGHIGGIYQAGNWIYTGKTEGADEYIYKGKRWHGRAFRKSHGSHLKYTDKGLKIIQGSSKYRYLMPLNEETKENVIKYSKPYPKRDKQAMAGTTSTAAEHHRPSRSNISGC